MSMKFKWHFERIFLIIYMSTYPNVFPATTGYVDGIKRLEKFDRTIEK